MISRCIITSFVCVTSLQNSDLHRFITFSNSLFCCIFTASHALRSVWSACSRGSVLRGKSHTQQNVQHDHEYGFVIVYQIRHRTSLFPSGVEDSFMCSTLTPHPNSGAVSRRRMDQMHSQLGQSKHHLEASQPMGANPGLVGSPLDMPGSRK